MVCPTGKICYPTPAAAWRVLEHMNNNRARRTHSKSGKGGFSYQSKSGFSYQCEKCRQWHVTHSQRVTGRPRGEGVA